MKTYDPNCLNDHFPIICHYHNCRVSLKLKLDLKSHDLIGYMHSRKCDITGFCYLDG